MCIQLRLFASKSSQLGLCTRTRRPLCVLGKVSRCYAAMAQTSVNSVSPASAFWQLSAIALNTMSQPSGRVLGLPSKQSFALRTSPVVCGLSVIDTVLEFCYHFFRTSSPPKAATEIVRFRLANLDNSVKDEFSVLRSNTIFRAITFFMGALP
jgi:hypothetical protein